jgi:hypothetical protein
MATIKDATIRHIAKWFFAMFFGFLLALFLLFYLLMKGDGLKYSKTETQQIEVN